VVALFSASTVTSSQPGAPLRSNSPALNVPITRDCPSNDSIHSSRTSPVLTSREPTRNLRSTRDQIQTGSHQSVTQSHGSASTTAACRSSAAHRIATPHSAAIFLDRDGTLIVDVPYNGDPNLVRVLPGVSAALRLLRSLGFRLIVVTNQSGVARGIIDESDIQNVHDRLNSLLMADGASVDAYYFCPHHPDGLVPDLARVCPYRKPQPGMLVRAANDWDIDLHRSWMIGDLASDWTAGRLARCQTLRIASPKSGSTGLLLPGLWDAAKVIETFGGSAGSLCFAEPRPTPRG
jgi:D,D-heptose 1,7-bisphosphate phosphatase